MIESCYQQYGQRKSKCIVVEHDIDIKDVLILLSRYTKHIVRLPVHPRRKIKGRQVYTLPEAIEFVRELKFTHTVYLRVACEPTKTVLDKFYEKPFDLEYYMEYNTTFIKNINKKLFTDVRKAIKEIFNKDPHMARSGYLYVYGTFDIVYLNGKWQIILLTKAPNDEYIIPVTVEDSDGDTQSHAAWQL